MDYAKPLNNNNNNNIIILIIIIIIDYGIEDHDDDGYY